MYFLFDLYHWVNYGAVALRVNEDGSVSRKGEPTDMHVEDFEDTCRTADPKQLHIPHAEWGHLRGRHFELATRRGDWAKSESTPSRHAGPGAGDTGAQRHQLPSYLQGQRALDWRLCSGALPCGSSRGGRHLSRK